MPPGNRLTSKLKNHRAHRGKPLERFIKNCCGSLHRIHVWLCHTWVLRKPKFRLTENYYNSVLSVSSVVDYLRLSEHPLERRTVAQPPAPRTPSASRRIRACPAPSGRRAQGGARLGAYRIIDTNMKFLDEFLKMHNKNYTQFFIILSL